MGNWWSNLSEGQGTVLAAGVTALAAGVGVAAGWLLFRGQVRDLGTALEKSKQLLNEHQEVVSNKLEIINDQIGAIIGRVSEVAGGVSDIQAGSGQAQDNAQQAGRRDDLKKNWIAIRDRRDSIAGGHPDGRTRAKYGRISRRNYHELIQALDTDEMIDGYHPMLFHELPHALRLKPGDPIGIPVIASLLREEMPWMYELGAEAYRAAKDGTREEAVAARRRFQRAAEMMSRGPFGAEELGIDPRWVHMVARELDHLFDAEPEVEPEPEAEKTTEGKPPRRARKAS